MNRMKKYYQLCLLNRLKKSKDLILQGGLHLKLNRSKNCQEIKHKEHLNLIIVELRICLLRLFSRSNKRQKKKKNHNHNQWKSRLNRLLLIFNQNSSKK